MLGKLMAAMSEVTVHREPVTSPFLIQKGV